MAGGSREQSVVHVEGVDDLHALVSLLIQHGLDYDSKRSELPEFKPAGGIHDLLETIEPAVRVGASRTNGFVLDADSPLADRWRQVRDRLAAVDVVTPTDPPTTGFIGESKKYKTRVGVWLMPDNQLDGTLETFLHSLIKKGDSLIGYATKATQHAKKLGAKFAEVDKPKAILHTWLAWRKEPGRPYGTAIRATFFTHDSPVAERFVTWFRELYQIAE